MTDFERIRLVEGCWIPCPDCDDYWCTHHDLHAWECDCPSIDVWAKHDIDPYRNE